jgi:hypothetical protein
MKELCTLVISGIACAGGLTAQERAPANPSSDPLPEVVKPIENFMDYDDAETSSINAAEYFSVPNDPDAELTFAIRSISDSAVAIASVKEQMLEVDFISQGQATVVLEASHNGHAVTDTFAVGVWPAPPGNTVVSDFNSLSIENESYWNGDDLTGGFSSGNAWFPNTYDPDYFSWTGWACSTISDNTTPGYGNQYSAITGGGMPSEQSNYAVSFMYPFTVSVMHLSDSMPRAVSGFFVTNSTWAALSMKKGDAYSKKFGGASGEDPDWFKLTIEGHYQGASSGSVEYYLADYRAEDPLDDFIIETWQWVDLTSLGTVDSLAFSLSSTDNGDWGMNTPSYFCIDQLHVEAGVTVEKHHVPSLAVCPNPFTERFSIKTGRPDEVQVTIFNMNGQQIYRNDRYVPGALILVPDRVAGTLVVEVVENGLPARQLVIKN